MISIPQNYTKYLFISLVGFLATYILVPVVMALAKRAGMVDKPDERRIHTGVTPLSRRIATHDAVFWAASLLGLMGLRLLPRIIQDMLPTILRYKSIEGIERIPCLVYGAGYGCTLFLRAQNQDADKKTTHQVVVALLDDDTNLHGRTIYGHKVIGGIEKLEAAVARYHVQQIVITTHLDDGIFQRVTDFASANHINVFKWRTDLRSQQFTDLHFSMDRNLREMTSRLLRTTPRTRVQNHFSWDRITDQLEEAYLRLK
jgi:FlaA1/EpsC-like NDP-sugar epimerase